MGASPVQVSMFFKQGNSGWSEVLTMDPEQFDNLDKATAEVTRSGGLGQLRAQLLGNGASIIGIRVSKFGVWRDSQYTATSTVTPNGLWDAPAAYLTDPAVNPWDVMTFRLECQSSYRRLVYLSGIPNSKYQAKLASGSFGSTFSTDLNKYFNYLAGLAPFTAGKFGTMVSSKNTDDPPVANVTTTPGAEPTYAVVNNLGVLTLSCKDAGFKVFAGQKVRLLGVKGPPGIDMRKWNGIFIVKNGNVAAQFSIYTKVIPEAINFPNLDFTKAYLFNPQPIFQKFTDWEFEGSTHRKRGVAFGTPRGRSRSQG